jgi:N-acetylmuramoyl-L-alanine amidase
MPGVLLELGFINTSDVKRMVQADFQQKIATAVVKGIKVFLGDAQ